MINNFLILPQHNTVQIKFAVCQELKAQSFECRAVL